ncbi:hypothetical protein [Phytoactinopolyspora limicola]|uniref:hypothetical protein n=1 Tax=Phytoactinopolyspora limicola TaxID=2715536 RepID=UPI00140A8725|nr:hypothetical protein [Phytoactinopolyspora limicola]
MNAEHHDLVLRVGTLRLSVAYARTVAGELGDRCQYRYAVESTDPELPGTYTSDDLYAGVGNDIDTEQAMQALGSFLHAAGESYGLRLAYPNRETENSDLFPEWVAEAAYQNSEELATLALEPQLIADETPEHGTNVQQYIGVVFQQSDDAEQTLRIINGQGPKAALEHLAAWDFGAETEYAAEANGHVYSEPPTGSLDREYADGEYVLTYNHAFGHVGLVRRIHTPSGPPTDTAPSTKQAPAHARPHPAAADPNAWTTPASQSQCSGLEPPSR